MKNTHFWGGPVVLFLQLGGWYTFADMGHVTGNLFGAIVLGVAAALGAGLVLTGSGLGRQVLFQGYDPLDASEPIPYFIADGSDIPGYEPADRDLAREAFGAWSRESGGRLNFVESDTENGTLVRLIWVTADQGLFGETQHIRVNGKPGAFVYVMPGVLQLSRELGARAEKDELLRDTIVYLTCVHELGHAVGLGHTDQFADIMYSFGFGGNLTEYFMRYRRQLESRSDIRFHSGLSESDTEALRALYAE